MNTTTFYQTEKRRFVFQAQLFYRKTEDGSYFKCFKYELLHMNLETTFLFNRIFYFIFALSKEVKGLAIVKALTYCIAFLSSFLSITGLWNILIARSKKYATETYTYVSLNFFNHSKSGWIDSYWNGTQQS